MPPQLMQLDLNKSAEKLRLSLTKAGVPAGLQMDIAFVLDVSGSFDDEHRDGITNDLLTRLVPWGLVFDPNGQLDVFTFSAGPASAHHVGTINAQNHAGYIAREIIRRVPGYGNGTDYSYVLEKSLAHFGWGPQTAAPAKKGWIGRSSAPAAPSAPVEQKRSLVIFVTDGDNSDKDRTQQILAASESRKDEVYFLFIGISNQGGNFPFLKTIGDRFGNTGLVVIRDLKKFVSQTDEQLNTELLGDELLGWLKR